MAFKVTNENFEALLAEGKPVVVDFWAEWCGPCKKIGPIVEELAVEYEDKVTVAKCDVEDADEIAAQYGIRNIPTILFIKNGEILDKQVGATDKATLATKIESLL
jgi:thioredoxin 1